VRPTKHASAASAAHRFSTELERNLGTHDHSNIINPENRIPAVGRDDRIIVPPRP
jgi:hypothetical protein